MTLISSLAIGDILMALSVVMIGSVCQVMMSEDFQARLDGKYALMWHLHSSPVTTSLFTSRLLLRSKSTLSSCTATHASTNRSLLHLCDWCGGPGTEFRFPVHIPQWTSKQTRKLHVHVRSSDFGKPFTRFIVPLNKHCHIPGTFVLYLRIYFTARRSGARMGIRWEGLLMKQIGIVIGTNFLFNFLPVVSIFIANPYARRGQIGYDNWVVLGVSLPIHREEVEKKEFFIRPKTGFWKKKRTKRSLDASPFCTL